MAKPTLKQQLAEANAKIKNLETIHADITNLTDILQQDLAEQGDQYTEALVSIQEHKRIAENLRREINSVVSDSQNIQREATHYRYAMNAAHEQIGRLTMQLSQHRDNARISNFSEDNFSPYRMPAGAAGNTLGCDPDVPMVDNAKR